MEPWYSLHWLLPEQWQQFRFAYPLALYLLPIIPVLFLLRRWISGGRQQRLSLSTGQHLAGNVWLSRLRLLLPISVFIGMGFLLVALARPQIVREQREEQAEGIDIMLAIDVSSSMMETDLKPNRLASARQVAQTFISGRKNDRIGLVVFAGEAFSLCPLTTDYALIRQYLDDLRENMIPTTGTAIGDALARCINRMRESTATSVGATQQPVTEKTKQKSKVVILLSDGENTAGKLDPIMAARLAKAFGIRLYTIAIGRVQAKGSNPLDTLLSSSAADTLAATGAVDEGVLKTIASIGNGSYFRATDAKRLSEVFEEINQLEKAPIRITVYENVQDYYRVYLYWAVVFLLVALLLKNTIVGNVLED